MYSYWKNTFLNFLPIQLKNCLGGMFLLEKANEAEASRTPTEVDHHSDLVNRPNRLEQVEDVKFRPVLRNVGNKYLTSCYHRQIKHTFLRKCYTSAVTWKKCIIIVFYRTHPVLVCDHFPLGDRTSVAHCADTTPSSAAQEIKIVSKLT